jgi:hypothetical protein
MEQMRYLISTLVLALLLHPIPLRADSFDPSKLQGLGDTRYQMFESETLGHALHLYVRVPESSEKSPDQRYPTIYLLDGGINYPLMSAYYHYLRLGEEIPEMILVGISYGSDRFKGGNFRASDFTAPSSEHEYWGKASTFQRVLERELMPLIEAKYASNPTRRIIFGHSLAGQYVLYSALTRPEMFWGHLANNPALHSNLDFFLDWKGSGEMPVDVTHLAISEGEFDHPLIKQASNEWIAYWSDPNRKKPFVLQVEELSEIGRAHV